jgi:hypothetical protein
MSENDKGARKVLKRVRQRGVALEPPSVEPIKPEIRSGGTFLFRDPLKRGVPAGEQQAILRARDEGALIASFVIEWGYDVPAERAREFRRWLLDNESELRNNQPEDVAYKGTYAVFSSSEKNTGNYRTIWAFNSLRAMQDFGAYIVDEDTTFSRLVRELNEFRDRERGAGYSQQVYQPAAGAHRML